MIAMKQEDLMDQAGMERAFQDYFKQVAEAEPGTFNAMLSPELIRCNFEKRELVLGVEVQDWMRNPGGMLHGGISASLLDFAMGILCRYFSGGQMTPTVTMEISYLHPAPVQGRICISARLTKCGGTIANALSSLWAEGQEDRLLATATGVYYVVRRDRGSGCAVE